MIILYKKNQAATVQFYIGLFEVTDCIDVIVRTGGEIQIQYDAEP